MGASRGVESKLGIVEAAASACSFPRDVIRMSSPAGPALEDSASAAPVDGAVGGRGPLAPLPPLASKALSEPFARLRYLDTSLLVWRQQQQAAVPQHPSSYLSRSQSAWYSSYGNSAVVVPDKSCLDEEQGRSRICALM